VNMPTPLQATVTRLNLPGFSFIICSVYLPPAVSVTCPAYSSHRFNARNFFWDLFLGSIVASLFAGIGPIPCNRGHSTGAMNDILSGPVVTA
jgi:hypothetical protein